MANEEHPHIIYNIIRNQAVEPQRIPTYHKIQVNLTLYIYVQHMSYICTYGFYTSFAPAAAEIRCVRTYESFHVRDLQFVYLKACNHLCEHNKNENQDNKKG